MTPLLPGSTIGIVGGGQLGRMLAMAAAQLGYRVHVYCPDHEPPATQVANLHIQADYEDLSALDRFAAGIDVATYEFENLPHMAMAHLARRIPMFPSAHALSISQDRLQEKDFLTSIGVATAPYIAVSTHDELIQAAQKLGLPAVLKTRRFGYDGKGQMMIRVEAGIEDAWDALRSAPGGLILERLISFEREISVIVARGRNGDARAYDPVWNTHENHILSTSRVPAGIAPDIADKAVTQALDVAQALDFIGVLTVEYFVTPDGAVLANEIAPRVHNSGHWTIEGAVTSQFENHIRAITGLSLGSTQSLGNIRMRNLIGRDVDDFAEIAADEGAHLHLYGKGSARLGRKMGHVTWVKTS